MLLRCNLGCKFSDGTTEGALDPDTDEVICNKCGDELLQVTSFTKRTMRSNGDILKKSAKAFLFNCTSCKRKVETSVIDGELRGKNCEKNCKFNVSRFMINSMENVGSNNEDESSEA